MADFRIENHGTIWTFTALSAAAVAWVRDNVDVPEHMRLGTHSFAADHRPARDIAEGIVSADLTTTTP